MLNPMVGPFAPGGPAQPGKTEKLPGYFPGIFSQRHAQTNTPAC
jgi:hypothetical protein